MICGAGAAGCVLANRTTADTSGIGSVELIEAGPDYPVNADLPADLANGRRNSMTAHDWGYHHRPTTIQVPFPLPRGKVVGGSTAVNTCIALRGHPYDYDQWGALGLADWSWDQCLPAFRRLERDLDFGDKSDYHGNKGPLPLRRYTAQEMVPWQAIFMEAALELGYPWCEDSNAPGSAGVGPHAMNVLDGRRISAAEAYLTPQVRARPGLQIRAQTLVRRVLFDDRKRVTGVEVEHGGTVNIVDTRRVVLCGGAINTPGILLRSGIGPAHDVERIGVELIADSPGVGRRLLDHPGSAIFMRPHYRQLIPRVDHPVIQGVLRYRSPLQSLPDTDMQIQAGSLVALQIKGRTVNLPLVSFMAPVGKPRGYGRLRYLSADPRAIPHIDSMLLEDSRDRAQAIEAMQLCMRLASTKAVTKVASPLWPSRRRLANHDRASEWIRKSTDSGYHPSGTVPMGPDEDPNAPCDGRGRVRGVTGLMVVDASLMPTIPSSNINIPTLMMAERFGAWLAEGAIDW